MEDKIIKYRSLIVITAIVITLLSLLLIPRLQVNSNVDDYVPDTIKNKVHLKELDSIFGGSEMILLMLHSEDVVKTETLNRLESLAAELSELEGLDRIISPFSAQEITIEDGMMSMEPFFEEIPDNKADYEALKTKISANSMTNRFFSDDFSLVSLVLIKNTKTPDKIIDDIKGIVTNHPGAEEVLLGGLPFIRYSIEGNIIKDLVVLLPIAMFLMVFMLYFSFKEWKGVFMPFLIVLMSIILSFGLMAFLGWKISLFSILMPIMIIAIANDYGIHLIAHYQELARGEEKLSMKQICKQIYIDLKKPIFITGITTIGGILGLLSHTMMPAAELGVLTAIGIGFALLLSLWLLPAMLSFFKPKRGSDRQETKKAPVLERSLEKMGNWVTTNPKKILTISVFTAVIGVIGIFFLDVDTNVESYFSAKSEAGRSTRLINEKFGGSQFISVLFSGDVLSPEVMNRMAHYESEIIKDPAVGLVSSPVALVKELSKGFYEPEEEGYNQIPDTSEEIYQFIEIFSMGGNEDDISQFLDYNYENARILISLKDGSNSANKRVLAKLNDLTGDDPDLRYAAGAGLTEIELADMVVKGQLKSLIFALAVVFIILSFVFRSPKAGLLSTLPITIAIVVLFGLMGIFGISLDIATALLSSIMIGVGVDYTIHFLWRFKTERSKGFDHRKAVQITLSTSGRGIIINALSVIVGFMPLILSNFTPLKYFGALIVISITTCLISSLFLVPAIVILTKPRFLE
ncbi:MMPL family transporter [uncultured Eudoraea sp.]|uniref:efflux RND transporter permease subunit n=1 Tax=uncultured Eudoraea sp. TaxID=1035614 RepID=UPI002624D3F2|nr:MMPL family transporter [uncultured Eudoraea sp.]